MPAPSTDEKATIPLPVTESPSKSKGNSHGSSSSSIDTDHTNEAPALTFRIGVILFFTIITLLGLTCAAVVLVLAFMWIAHLTLFLPALFSLLGAALARILPWLGHLVWPPTTSSALSTLASNLRAPAFWTDAWTVLGYLLLALIHVAGFALVAFFGFVGYLEWFHRDSDC